MCSNGYSQQWIGGDNNNDLIYHNGSLNFANSTQSKVGIGTTDPRAKFHLAGGDFKIGDGISEPGNIILVNQGSNGWTAQASIVWDGSKNVNTRRTAEITTGNILTYGRGDLIFKTKGSLDDALPTTKMTIKYDGNIGIGVSNPLAKLHVRGGLYLHGDEAYESGWTITRLNWKGHSLIMGSQPGRHTHNRIELKPGGSSTGELRSSFEMYSSPSENQHDLKIRLESSGKSFINGGNLGIGTTTPSHKLDVKGTIHAEEVLVNLTVEGPDYVFEEDYPLQKLSDLETFLKENKH
ncbi:hypothetical protein E1176_00645, partial [Fulvivirga sp. RKSG066]|nr:hypothetical protein [Fulvivirga aurantia]